MTGASSILRCLSTTLAGSVELTRPRPAQRSLQRLLIVTLLVACGGRGEGRPFRHPPTLYRVSSGNGDLLMAYTYQERHQEVVEWFDLAPEVRVDVVVHDGVVYAPTTMARGNGSCEVQGGCLEPFAIPPDLMARFQLRFDYDGSFLVADASTLFDGTSGDPPRLAFAVRHPECFGPLCAYVHDAAMNLQTPWWPELRFMELCPVDGGASSTLDMLEAVPDEPESVRLVIQGPFGLRPARDPTGVCIRHDRPADHISVDSILRFFIHEPFLNCSWYPELCGLPS